MKEKITFKELSGWIKLGLITSWILFGFWSLGILIIVIEVIMESGV